MAASDQTLASADPASADGDAGRPSNFRPDIEGLRAVAIGLVVLYHAHVPFVPSGFVGVDVFFVISGFLITGLLIREIERTGRVSLRTFYARRAKRLLPATAVVLVVTAVLTRLLLPVTQWRDFGGDIVASALYLVNWRFADRAVDYLAEDVGPSPVLHFWSLAVEEQFYLVWPLLLLAVTLVLRKWPAAPARRTMFGALLLVAVPSFVWSVHLSATNSTAFFVTTTRLWELAVGAFVAIGLARWRRLPVRVAGAIGWLGLLAIAVSAVVFESASAWPGVGALLPTLGSAAVIIGGTAAGTTGPGRLLGLRLMVGLGALSYSLYLWHWPMLVIADAWRGGLGMRGGLLVVAASFVPAWLSMRFVENPIRFSRAVGRSPRLALSLGANFSLIGVVAGMALVLALPASTPGRQGAGAEAVAQPGTEPEQLWQVDEVEWIVPDPLEATKDVPEAYADGCQVALEDSRLAACDYGVADPAPDAFTVVLAGDSKALQWVPALQPIAQDEGWRLLVITKSACTLTEPTGEEETPANVSCAEWNEKALDELLGVSPDLVLVSGGAPYSEPTEERIEALAQRRAGRWERLLDAGIPVVPIMDTPVPDFQVYECVAEHRDELSACSFDRVRGVAVSGTPVLLRAAELAGAPAVIDLTDVVCPGDRCPPVIGNVLVYRQGSHVTRTFAESAAAEFAERLAPLVDDLTEGD